MKRRYFSNVFYIGILFLIASMKSSAQGISFDNSVSWNEVQAKAKKDNKLIFVDVMATWCGPCKQMAETAFRDIKVGNLMKDKFIAVKLQIDQTKNDNSQVKAWYEYAKRILKEYNIEAYPTLLFFSPDGILVHRTEGARDANGLIAEIQIALDPTKQYSTLLSKYEHGDYSTKLIKSIVESAWYNSKDYPKVKDVANDFVKHLTERDLFLGENLDLIETMSAMSKSKTNGFEFYELMEKYRILLGKYNAEKNNQELVITIANLAKMLDDKEVYRSVSQKYIEGLDKKNIYTKYNLAFIGKFTEKSSDFGFSILFNNPQRINKMTRDYFAQDVVNGIIFKEELASIVDDKNRPVKDWGLLAKRVAKYRQFGEEKLLQAQTYYYYNSKKYDSLFVVAKKYLSKYKDGERNSRVVNNIAWEAFLVSTDSTILNEALKWSAYANKLEPNTPNWMDTYANLLYKLGRKQRAIALEKRVLELDPTNKEFAENLKKMKSGIKTWIVEEPKK